MPKVSIIIPIYNTEKYLSKCLDSVINQTLKDIEIICVNDCSPDNSLSILKKYASKDDRIKIINNEINRNLGMARNIAMEAAKSDYIMFLDSDDWYEENACEEAYNQIVKYNNDFVMFGFRYLNETTQVWRIGDKIKDFDYLIGKSSITLKDLTKPFLNGGVCWNKIYNKKFLIDNKILFPEGYHEDGEFTLKVFLNFNNFSILDIPLYCYLIRPNSISTVPKNNLLQFVRTEKCLKDIEEMDSIDKKYIDSMAVRAYRHTWQFLEIRRFDKNVARQIYNHLHKFFIRLNKKYKASNYKDYINYKLVSKIIKYNYWTYRLLEILPSIFSIQNKTKKGIKRKIITIFGLKIKLKKK